MGSRRGLPVRGPASARHHGWYGTAAVGRTGGTTSRSSARVRNGPTTGATRSPHGPGDARHSALHGGPPRLAGRVQWGTAETAGYGPIPHRSNRSGSAVAQRCAAVRDALSSTFVLCG